MTFRIDNTRMRECPRVPRPQTLWVLLFGMMLVTLTACDLNRDVGSVTDHYNAKAIWDEATQTLKVSGTTQHDDDGVEIHDATDGVLLGSALVNNDGTWTATADTAACSVHVTLPSGTVTVDVNNAPQDCAARSNKTGESSVASRAIPDSSPDKNNPEPLATIPNSIIVEPRANVTVNVGEYIEFKGVATGANISSPVSYYWNFGGGAQNTSVQNPGPVVFSQPGTYVVQLQAIDNAGVPDPTPATRIIVVNGTNTVLNTFPVPTILSPNAINGEYSVNVGDPVLFSGNAIDPTGAASNFTYEWDFAGAVPTQFGAQLPPIVFPRAGVFNCSLTAITAAGIRSQSPARIIIRVGLGSVGGGIGGLVNQSPVGHIRSPRQDVTIQVGNTLSFEGHGRDPDQTFPLTYSWDFGGAAAPIINSPTPNAGTIQFLQPGVYPVSLRVTDALGATDLNPPVRLVTVLPSLPGSTLPPGTTIPPINTPLSIGIVSPPTNVTIQPGQSVFFSGQPVGGLPSNYRYLWTFGGGAPTSVMQTPGDIAFSLPGQYLVEFTIADLQGNVIGAPDSRIITVLASAGGFPPGTLPPGSIPPGSVLPNVSPTIVSPANRSTVNVGAPVNLVAQVSTPTFSPQLRYEWEITQRGFTTALYTSSQLSPPPFVFSVPGQYRVAFRVRTVDQFGNFSLIGAATNLVTVVDTVGTVANLSPILFPAQDMILQMGNSLNFQAGTISGSNLNYQWDFGGLAPQSFLPTPPPLIFNRAGTFVITLRITGVGVGGVPLNLFGQRVITVTIQTTPGPFPTPIPGPGPFPQPFPTPFPGPTPSPFPGPNPSPLGAPDGFIDTPPNGLTVRVGQPVQFSGRGFDPLGTGALRYQWSFGGAAPNVYAQTPGLVAFNRVGTFVVALLVINQLGQYDANPPTVVITVTP